MANVPKKEIKDKLAKVLKVKEEVITIFGLKTKFGGGRSSGFALVYDSADARKQYDSKASLLRVSVMLILGGSFKIYGARGRLCLWPLVCLVDI
jgi:ribosomal protein S24E